MNQEIGVQEQYVYETASPWRNRGQSHSTCIQGRLPGIPPAAHGVPSKQNCPLKVITLGATSSVFTRGAVAPLLLLQTITGESGEVSHRELSRL